MTASLRVTEFRALWLAEAQSVAGDQLAKVAMAILVYDRTHSALWSAGVYALTFLPALIGGLGLSHLADRYPRKQLMVVCTVTQAVLAGLMTFTSAPLVLLCALLVLTQLVQSPFFAAQNALTREVFVDDEDLYLRSQDLRGVTTNTMMLLGLAGGGAIVALIGTSWALAVDAITYAIAAVVIHRWVKDRPAAGGRAGRALDGARWLFGRHDMRVLFTLSWLVGLAVVPEGIVAPLADEMGAGRSAVGWLLAADPAGYIVGTFVLSRYVAAERRRRLAGPLTVVSLLLLVGFVIEPSMPVALALLAASGAVGAYQITVMATFNSWVPNEIRGGAIGVARTGLRVSQGVGVALGGVLAQQIGPQSTIAVAGVLGVVIAVPAAVAWSKVLDRHAESEAASSEA
ncbi:MFS transporter [Luteipulveratus mongoliensis]|uniref:Arabinose ABC transporter permease n=1 Tax=Luteipulveratus mongoliensis TaxID=571913 RepID=A0A0K1JQ48_9MICO|nr:MFS transporter [Luteipulveratus mongoliensis]AKU18703.1 arabinose ABC transporter permease [Luteipulveratus mongoliensis]